MDDELSNIATRADLASFLLWLSKDCTGDAQGWEHVKVADYLEAISAWLHDSEGDPAEDDVENVWQTVARCFLAGKYYE